MTRVSAVADMTWYWSDGRNGTGYGGLKSSMGAQIAVLEMGLPQGASADASASESAMHRHIDEVTIARVIEARLRQLTRGQYEVLRLTFNGSPQPRGIPAVCILTASLRRLYVAQAYRTARAWLKEARTRKKRNLDPKPAIDLVQRYRLEARSRRTATIGHQTARDTVTPASDAERTKIESESKALIEDAIQAYEATILPDEVLHAKRVMSVDDPRPSRRPL